MTARVHEDVAVLADRPGAVMGLDPGTKTIGVAVSDGLRMTATPLETVRRGKFKADAARLREIAQGRGVVGVVVGLPRNMDGTEGPRAQSARAFARNVAEALGLPVVLWDERMTTLAAERMLIDADASRRRRAEVIDKVAASYILQGALDRLAVIARDGSREA